MQTNQPSSQSFREKVPLVVGSLEGAFVNPAEILLEDCDLVELRLDGWSGELEAGEFAQKCALPILMTARDGAEGGKAGLSQAERAEALRAHFSVAQAIDLEIANLGAMSEVWEEAKQAQLFRVASSHDFEKPMLLDEMLKKVELAQEAGADVAKFAFRLHERKDLEVGLKLLEAFKEEEIKISVMGMGELGPESRVLYGRAGSLLNYGYLGTQETAPGQMAARDLKVALFEV